MSPVENLYTFEENYAWESTAAKSTFTVKFPKNPSFDLLLIGAELIQEVESHEVLILTFKGKVSNPTATLASSDPVLFVYSAGSDVSTFEGYVYSVDPSASTQAHVTTVVCTSASDLLKDSDQKIYKNVTADQVVQKICSKHGLKAVTQRHPRLREAIVNPGQTDWQMLKRLAKTTGFALKVENTSIIFMSKNKIYQDKKERAAYFKYKDGITKLQRTTGTCLTFEPKVSDNSIEIGARVDRVMNGTSTHPVKDYRSSVSRGVVVPNKEYFDGI